MLGWRLRKEAEKDMGRGERSEGEREIREEE